MCGADDLLPEILYGRSISLPRDGAQAAAMKEKPPSTSVNGSRTATAETMLGAETRYFFELTPERILDSVETVGVRCTGRSLALNSMENRVYDVEVEPEAGGLEVQGRFVVAKFYRPGRWSREQIEEEHRFLLDLAEYELPVVAPLVAPDGRTLFEVPEIGIYFAVFPKVGGRSPDEPDDEQLATLGRLIARVHGVGSIRPAEHRLRMTPEQFLRESGNVLERSGTVTPSLAGYYFAAIERLADRVAPLFSGVPFQRIHGDCHLRNVLSNANGLFLVDFDDMVMGPPVQDLWLLVPGRDADSRQQLDLVLEGYEQMRSFDRSTLRLIEPLRTMRLVHFSAWIAKRWDDPAFPAAFPAFGTDRYWREQIDLLREQEELIGEL